MGHPSDSLRKDRVPHISILRCGHSSEARTALPPLDLRAHTPLLYFSLRPLYKLTPLERTLPCVPSIKSLCSPSPSSSLPSQKRTPSTSPSREPATTYTFSLDSSPIPDAISNGLNFTLDNILVNVNDQFGQSSDIRFFNTSEDGGLGFLDLPGVILEGDQLYTGTEAAPTFRTGTFNLLRLNTTPFTLTIAPGTSPVPEPGTFALLGTGAIATLRSIRRRRTS